MDCIKWIVDIFSKVNVAILEIQVDASLLYLYKWNVSGKNFDGSIWLFRVQTVPN